ncbi:unnamed protein product [Sphenostylis stenocarpa]|uniref:Uncharacterized protein n=1 Tax=Sphenostylis stenocarpa TaxID=92480 RepID=A0AA86VV38_9FABA|nr:unnamed protein product [Sphenostylis stenocarpa]
MEAETNSPDDASAVAIDQTQFMGKDTAVIEHADHQSEAPSMENVITKHSNSDEKLPTESSIKSKYDKESAEKIPESYSVDNSEIKDDGKIMREKALDIDEATEVELQISETKSVPEYGTLKTLSTTAYVGAEELENKDDGKFTQEKAKETEEATEMQPLKSATDSPREDKEQSTVSTSEIVKGHTDEVSQQQTHKNDETSVIDTEKSRAEKHKPEGDGKEDNGAKATEEAVKTMLLNIATKSLLEEEVQPRLPVPSIVQHDTDQIIKQQPLNKDVPEVIDNAKSSMEEKELDIISRVIETSKIFNQESVQHETKDNVSIVKEQADQQSEEISMRSVIKNYIIESSTNLIDDVPESHLIKTLEKKAEEATDDKESTIVEIPKSEIEGESEDKALQTLPSAELVGNEAVDVSCEEDVKPEADLTVTHTEQTLQHEFDTKNEIPEEVECQLSAENEQKSEPQIAAKNNEMACIKHPYLDGETAEINPSNDTVEEVTVPHTKEKQAIEDTEKFNQEEVQGTEKEVTIQLPNTTTESQPEEEIQIKLPTPSFVQGDIDQISQQHKQHNDESEAMDNAMSCISEIELAGKSTTVEKRKGIEEAIEMQLPEEAVQIRSPTPTFAESDTDQILQQETLHVNKSEVIDNVNQICIPEIELERRSTVVHEIEKLETNDNVSKSKEILDNKDAYDIRGDGGTNAKQLADVEIPKSETEGVPTDEALQPTPSAVSVENEANNDNSQEEKQSEAEFTEKFNKEMQKPQYFIGETAQNDTTNDTEDKEDVRPSHPEEILAIEDDDKLEPEAKGIEEVTKMQLPDEQLQTKSHTSYFGQVDNDQVPHQETSYVNESEVIDKAKKNCMPVIELFKQETEKPETKDNVGIVTENLDNKNECDIRSQEGTDVKLLADAEIPKSETEGALKDEVLQPIATEVSVTTEAVDENSQEIQLEADVTVKSNKEVQISEYVTDQTVEINATKYTDEQVVEIDRKLSQEEATEMQLQEEEAQTRLDTPAFVQHVTNQILEQEIRNVDESEVLDNAEQRCIPENELDGKSIVVQETEKPETKDKVGIVTENLDNKDANDITSEKETDDKQLTTKTETKGIKKGEPIQPISRAVSVGTKAQDDENRQEEIQPEADVSVKSNKEVQRPEYITDSTAEINATNYTAEQEEIPKSQVLEKEGIEDDGKFSQEEEAKGIEEATPKQLQEEEVQTRSSTPAFGQGDTNQIPQQETLQVNESEVIDNAKQSFIPEIKLEENSSVVQVRLQ